MTIEEVNYDECVRMAAAEADACERGVIVQDTAWEGYEKIPWIMEGYGTMASGGLPSSCARCHQPPDARVYAGRRGVTRRRRGRRRQPLSR